MAEDAKVGSIVGSSDYEDKMVKKSPLTSNNLNKAIGYLTPKAKLAFTQLRKTFTKALILRHFDSECYIWIETDASSYAISRILSQLALDNVGWWYPVIFYLQKMIPAKTRYKTDNGELLGHF